MGKTTLSVDESTLERFHQQKTALEDVQDAPDHTTDSFLNALMDTWEASGDPATLAEVAPKTFAEHLVEELPQSGNEAALAELHDALATIEERTGRIERAIEDLGGRA